MDVPEHDVREEALRKDAAWLQGVSDALHDARYARALHHMRTSSEFSREWTRLGIDASLMQTWAGFDGDTMMLQIAKIAMRNLRIDSSAGQSLPRDLMVMTTAIPSVNGFCISSPNLGTPAIVLNHGITLYVSYAVHLVLGITAWAGESYCDHYADETRIRDLFRLAELILTRRIDRINDIESASCILEHNRSPNKMLFELSCTIGELFIVFHELGHIALNHLSRDDITLAFDEDSEQKLPVFNRSKQNEFHADLFAIRQLMQMYHPVGVAERDVAYGAGCLFILMAAVEELAENSTPIDTHPPAAERWRSVRSSLAEPHVPCALDSIDYFFKWNRERK